MFPTPTLHHSRRLLARGLAGACLMLALTAAHAQAAAPALSGAGASFPAPVYKRWAADYGTQTGLRVDYDAVGSGEGLARIERRRVDFGASDMPLSVEQLEQKGLLQFPAVIGGVVPVVNLAGIRSGELKLTAEVLADIFLGRLKRWNDPAIAALNPGLDLPRANITVVHRADASGTTFLLSSFLARSSPAWRSELGVGSALAWPAGVAEVGSTGVASSVQRVHAAIGYVEYAYARQHHLSVAALRNRDGFFVKPERASFEAAALAAPWQSAADLSQMLIDLGGPGSWPITGASFILLPRQPAEPARTVAVLKFFDWALHQGRQAAQELDYVPMPELALPLVNRVWAEQGRGRAGPLWPPSGD